MPKITIEYGIEYLNEHTKDWIQDTGVRCRVKALTKNSECWNYRPTYYVDSNGEKQPSIKFAELDFDDLDALRGFYRVAFGLNYWVFWADDDDIIDYDDLNDVKILTPKLSSNHPGRHILLIADKDKAVIYKMKSQGDNETK